MKTSKKLFTVLTCLFVLSISTYSSISYADGVDPEPHLKMMNATLNGVPFNFVCNDIAVLPLNSLIEFDIYVSVYTTTIVNYSFNPAAPPGIPTFTPSLPLTMLFGSAFIHFSWLTPTAYSGSLRISATDPIGQYQSCELFFDWALPVNLSSFVSIVNVNDVTLNWTTAAEQSNSGFDIERSNVNSQTPASQGGSNEWTKISFVQGNGTTTSPKNYNFTDRNLTSGKYNYRLKQIDFNGNFEYFNLSNEVNIGIPDKFSLSQNYPNPFNPSTKISYNLPFDGKVSLKVFDVSGKEVMSLTNEIKTAGYYEEIINGSRLSSGVYFYRLTLEGNGNNFVSTKKMLMTK